MSRILVEVTVPAAGRSRDVSIPYECRVQEIAQLVMAVFAEESAHTFEPTGDSLLCDATTGVPLDANLTPEEIGLLNGSRLLLI